jgi:hypothetical protein
MSISFFRLRFPEIDSRLFHGDSMGIGEFPEFFFFYGFYKYFLLNFDSWRRQKIDTKSDEHK